MFTKIARLEPLRLIKLTEAKNQLNIIDFNDDDDHIEALILAASEMCEKAAKRYFSRVTVTGEFNAGHSPILLGGGSIDSITSVTVGGVEVGYSCSFISQILTITSGVYASDTVTVVYDAGIPLTDTPEMVRHSCKIIVSDLYNHRESSTDTKHSDTIFNALRLVKNAQVG